MLDRKTTVVILSQWPFYNAMLVYFNLYYSVLALLHVSVAMPTASKTLKVSKENNCFTLDLFLRSCSKVN